jgi:hypothetical protein
MNAFLERVHKRLKATKDRKLQEKLNGKDAFAAMHAMREILKEKVEHVNGLPMREGTSKFTYELAPLLNAKPYILCGVSISEAYSGQEAWIGMIIICHENNQVWLRRLYVEGPVITLDEAVAWIEQEVETYLDAD